MSAPAVSAPFENLAFDVENGVAWIRLSRPAARNALNMALKSELAETIAVAGDREDVRAVVLTGEGKAFCAGGDIDEMVLNDSPRTSRVRLQALLANIFVPLAQLEKPTIAAINGHAHGAGLSLALACDIALAADSASLSCAFAKVGLVPDCGSLYFLPRRVGIHVAKELIFTGRRLAADEALGLGLLNRVVPAERLLDEARTLAEELAAGPTTALGMAKSLLDASTSSTLSEIAQLEVYGQAIAYSTRDHLSARNAFTHKTSPRFVGH